jgi:flavin reductase (DIM6/NTAB) family NADH-FMN oxidoreductase RutF
MQESKEKLTRKKPWNRASLAVYSVSSMGEKPNMHICTYVSAVSMKPKRMMVAIYHGTQTLRNVEQTETFVLQLLASHQYRLVDMLGKKSGLRINKILRLQQKKLLHTWNGFEVLNDCLATMLLKPITHLEAGDHRMYLCDVLAYRNISNGLPLTTQILHEKGIIRA